jgi:hypothetical protein
MIKNSRLVGAVLMGEQTLCPTVQRLIEDGVDMGIYLRALRSPHVDLAQVLVQVRKQVA